MYNFKPAFVTGCLVTLLTACVSSGTSTTPVIDGVSVTMVQTNVPYQGAVETFFSFTPTIERPLEVRVQLAQVTARSKGCTFLDVPLSEVQRLTTRQAPENANLFLIAPVTW